MVSESFAANLGKNPVGSTITLDNSITLTVAGIFKDLPRNTQIHSDIFVSLKTVENPAIWGKGATSTWQGLNFHTFFLLNSTSIPENLIRDATEIFRKHQKGEVVSTPFFEKLSRIYIHSDSEYSLTGNSKSLLISILILTTILIIALSTINTVNIATAKASVRTTETALRKLLGGNRSQLFLMVLTEYIALGLAVMAPLTISSLFTGDMLQLLSKAPVSLNINLWFLLFSLIYLILSVLITTLSVTGFLLKFYTPSILRGRKTSNNSALFKKIMLFIQFAISTTIIIGTVQIAEQLKYIDSRPLGFTRTNLLYLRLNTNDAKKRAQVLQHRLEQMPEVVSTSLSSRVLGNVFSGWWLKGKDENKISVTALFVDYDFLKTFGMKIHKGRSFSKDHPSDATNGIILNKEAVKALGMKDPVGKSVNFSGMKQGIITGVIEDINFQPLNRKASPLVITFNQSNYHKWFIGVRLHEGQYEAFLNKLDTVWKKFAPDSPLSVIYQEDILKRLYKSEGRLLSVMIYSSFIVMFISCTGLIGISSFIIQSRLKELSIRKVLGATTGGMIRMLINEFGVIVTASLIVSVPSAFIISARWLSNYSFRISQAPGTYISTAILMLIITAISICATSWKAASVNPASAMRNE